MGQVRASLHFESPNVKRLKKVATFCLEPTCCKSTLVFQEQFRCSACFRRMLSCFPLLAKQDLRKHCKSPAAFSSRSSSAIVLDAPKLFARNNELSSGTVVDVLHHDISTRRLCYCLHLPSQKHCLNQRPNSGLLRDCRDSTPHSQTPLSTER